MLDLYWFRKFVGNLLSPYVLLFLLFTAIVAWIVIRGKGRLVKLSLLLLWFILFVGSTGWLSVMISDKIERHYPAVTVVNPDIHWVVVLGGGVRTGVEVPANFMLTSGSIYRLLEGVRLYRQLPQAKLLLSGGDKSYPITQSTAVNMERLASLFKIPKASMVVEPFSINTAEEAVTIKKRLGNAPFYLVTSAMHLPRAMALCQKQGLHPVAAPANFPYPYEDMTNWKSRFFLIEPSHWVFIQSAWHEVLGIVWGKWMKQL